MEHLHSNNLSVSPAGVAVGSSSLFTVTDMTPETVISEMNLFSKCNHVSALKCYQIANAIVLYHASAGTLMMCMDGWMHDNYITTI